MVIFSTIVPALAGCQRYGKGIIFSKGSPTFPARMVIGMNQMRGVRQHGPYFRDLVGDMHPMYLTGLRDEDKVLQICKMTGTTNLAVHGPMLPQGKSPIGRKHLRLA
jgi:hypothetical protein